MKKYLLLLFAFILMTGISCQKKIDINKEKEAIKAVFEGEKDYYFKQDYISMGEFWVKDASSIKIFMSGQGQTKYDGWDQINASVQKETQDTSWNRKLATASFTNYQIDVMNNSAWVLCETHWNGIFRNDTIKDAVQTRIGVLAKVEGKWKFKLVAIYSVPAKME